MHVKHLLRWPKLFLVSGLISIVLALLLVPGVRAQSTTPTASCNASRTSCTVSFPYSGDYYVWTPPADVRSVNFSLWGAQGGRSGGNGAKASATFRTVPTGPLYVFVGGQGSSGNGAAGGYNGGGAAGSGHGDEGSGGGATDIRSSLLLADRIAVAGGGGGAGGGSAYGHHEVHTGIGNNANRYYYATAPGSGGGGGRGIPGGLGGKSGISVYGGGFGKYDSWNGSGDRTKVCYANDGLDGSSTSSGDGGDSVTYTDYACSASGGAGGGGSQTGKHGVNNVNSTLVI